VSRAALALAWLACAGALAGAARAQTPAEQVARGVRAYRDLDYDGATTILRAALSMPGSALADTDRVRALVYLGASELYRDRRDSAAALFGRLLRVDPRYHIDQLVFPPEVTGLFQQVRLVTRAVAVVAPPVTELHAAGDALPIMLYATTFHSVDVAVLRPNGVLLRTVYQGSVGDSLQVRWDGRAADGNPADSGHYQLEVDSRGADGRVVHSVALPLDVSRVRRDTLALPAPPDDSLLKPEQAPGTSGLRALVSGFVTATAVAVLPSLVAGRASASADRFVVAGGLSLAAILGFRAERRPQPIPANIAANRALQAAWQRQADSVHAQNVARRQEVRILIRVGAARVVGAP
jgi:hypothetical protein